MCGIMGYVNHMVEQDRNYLIEILLEGLARLDYRGYDSTGLVVDGDEADQALSFKIVGKVADLKQLICNEKVDLKKTFTSHVGIAHTRWAANGSASVLNCHPHRSDPTWRFSIVHNGIVTNYKELRTRLASEGYECEGDTDTEVVAKLAMKLHDQHPTATFQELACTLVKDLHGAFSFLLKSRHYPNEIIAVKKGSPLIIGLKPQGPWQPEYIHVHPAPRELLKICTDSTSSTTKPSHGYGPGEFYLASDPSAIASYTKRMVVLEEDEVAHIKGGILMLYRSSSTENTTSTREIQKIENLHGKMPTKGDFQHFMRKEIFEQPTTIQNALTNRLEVGTDKVTLNGLNAYMSMIRKCSRIVFIACGSSYYACLGVRETIEKLHNVTVSVDIASDFIDRSVRISSNAAYVFVSQSGETAECLVALRYVQEFGGLTIGIVNVVNSSIARLTHCGIYLNAGIEIGVATTKAYTSQFVTLVLFALVLSAESESMQERRLDIMQGLRLLPDQVRRVLELDAEIKILCKNALTHCNSMLVLGRGYQFPTALESALKIKEVSYIHCEAVMTGELKHGVLALVDEERIPVVMIATRDTSFSKTLNGYEQLVSHGGKPIMVCDKGEKAFDNGSEHRIEITQTLDCLQGVLNVIPLQLMAYWLGVLKDNNVDFPRNVAKSVTVE